MAKDKIEKIKEILADKDLFYDKGKKGNLKSLRTAILLDRLFRDVSNLKFPVYDSKGEVKIPGDIKPYSLVGSLSGDLINRNKDILEHKLLAVTHARISRFHRTEKHERIYDLYFHQTPETIFLDLDKQVYDTGNSGSSGKRGTYDELSVIFEKAKAPTLIPIFVGKELLTLEIFPRYIGYGYYHNQWRHYPKEKTPQISHLTISDIFRPRKISVWLEPEKKEKKLIEIY